jgi:hypothetical protein
MYLVTVTPEKVLGANVLVRILDLVFQWRRVLQMLLVSIPPHLSIDTGEHKAWNGDAASMSICLT